MQRSTLDRWRQIEEVLDSALDLPPEQRVALLDRRCAGDADLRRNVEQLLSACVSSEHFLEQPVAGAMAPLVALSLGAPELPEPGTRVGAYRIVREAGRGGMGVVYLAERDDGAFSKRVALKLVRRAPGPGDVLTRRFHEERQILASLEHPGIARLLDGGALEDGRPYYVMEYVEGTTIDRFCDEHRLDVAARLELFGKVCDAVEHAHQKQVVHRDLKPSNILVTSDSAVKLLDFGIATLLAPIAPIAPIAPDATRATLARSLTPAGASILTPEYASPEQVRGEAASARSDVYSLGIILYELLCGRHPQQRGAAPHVVPRRARTARRDAGRRARGAPPPEPPSRATLREPAGDAVRRAAARRTTPPRLRARLAGELDDVVLAALREEPGRRYASAGDLAADVRRHLAGEPVHVRPVGLAGRARAVLRRYRTAMAAAVLGGGVLAAVAPIVLREEVPRGGARSSAVAVLPFTPAEPDTVLQRLGRNLVSTLSVSLDGIGGLRMVDAQAILGQSRDPRESAAAGDGVQALGRRLGAGMVIRGTLARVGTRVRADGVLLDTDRAAPVASVSVTAMPEDLDALTDSLAWALLRQLSRIRSVRAPDLAGVTTRSLAALRAHSEGERLTGEYRLRAAEAAFARAIAADSSFWLAYWRLAWARELNAQPVDSAITATYLAHRAELAVPERLLIEARMAERFDDRRERLESLVARFPSFWRGWFELGELHVRYAPFAGHALAEAARPFRRTTSLNGDFVPGWDRLLWVAIAGRDTVSSAWALAQLERLRYDSTSVEDERFDMLIPYRHLHHLARTGGIPHPFLADSLARAMNSGFRPSANGMPDRLRGGIVRFGFHGARIDLARRQLASALVPPQFHWQVIANSWAARGAWDSALVAMAHAADNNVSPAGGIFGYRLAAVGQWLGAVDPAAAAAWRERAAGVLDRLRPVEQAELAWLDGLLASTRRDAPALARARTALRRSGAPALGHLDSSLAAFARELAGDRRGALAMLLAVERERRQVGNSHPYVAGVHRLTASAWLSAAGDPAGAERLLLWHEAIGEPGAQAAHANALLAPFAQLARARVLEARGQREAARVQYQHFLRGYDSPVPAHAPLVAEARAGIARMARR